MNPVQLVTALMNAGAFGRLTFAPETSAERNAP